MLKEKTKNQCMLCSGEGILLHKGVRDNADIDVLQCKDCGFVFLSDFSHIDENFYEDGKMTGSLELQKWQENTLPDDKRRAKNLQKILKDKTVTDFGCGNAGFLNLIKDQTQKSYGIELQKDFLNYFKKCKLDVVNDIKKLPEKSDVITMFHVLEHIKNPIEHLKNIKHHLNKNGKIVIEVPNANDALLKLYNCKSFQDFTYWSCHLYVYDEKSLKQIFNNAGYKVIKTEFIQRYTLMNHLYWIFKHKPAGHKHWAKYDYKLINAIYTSFLKLFKITDTISFVIEPIE